MTQGGQPRLPEMAARLGGGRKQQPAGAILRARCGYAGIGENSAPMRAEMCKQMEWAGVKIDPAKNAAAVMGELFPVIIKTTICCWGAGCDAST